MNAFFLNFSAMLFVIAFAFSLSAFCSFLMSKLGFKIALIDKPNERSSHSLPTPRGGGIGIWFSFLVVFLLLVPKTPAITYFAAAATIMALLGLLEDRFSFSSKLRLIIHLGLAAWTIFLFKDLYFYSGAIVLFVFWLLFIAGTANFYNFMDGINGIAGLIGTVAFGLTAYFSYYMVQDMNISILSIALFSACLGFLPFNLLKAKIFMGDVGSVFLGFVFAAFVVKLSSNISIFLCLIMFLCTFYADAVITIYQRWRRGENLLKAHRRHLYQYLSNELGISHWLVSVIYAGVQSVFGLIALLAYGKGLVWQFAVFGVFSIFFLVSYMVIKGLSPIAEKTRMS
ncbi:MAG: hypothetical protein COS28_08460 [Nitrospirae bacterium CG02_land_8_20_14_3_00_44_33]|nr:MAG: hypothetical protein COS28_08460 [Nitrospirae bacterium CG02_land_8_20_14_3_00_44_33]